MALAVIDYINGSSSLIFVVISIAIGVKIILKYREHKRKELLYVGLTWILLCEIWWASSISFLVAVFNNGEGLSESAYFLIGGLFVPVAALIWLKVFTDLIRKDIQKQILIVFLIIGVIFEVYLIWAVVNNPRIIGVLENPVNARFTLLYTLFLIGVLSVFLITGIIFATTSLRSENAEIKLKGKFLLIALISFFAGAVLDGTKYFFVGSIANVVIVVDRLILVSSALEFYIGFILPPFVKKLFLAE